MTTLTELNVLANAEPDAFQGIAACYEALLYGVPSAEGFAYLIGNAVATNYGSNDFAIEFNRENIFINVANSLVAGNAKASANFQEIIGEATTLTEKIIAICSDIGVSQDGLGYLTRPEALAFYEAVAVQRGVAGSDGAAIVAMASLLEILVREDVGVGDAVNDLQAAVGDGTALLPEGGGIFTPIGVADGWNYDSSDPEPAEQIVYHFTPPLEPNSPDPLPEFILRHGGRYHDVLDFTAFIDGTNFVKVAAGEIGAGDGFDAAGASIVLVELDANVTSETLAGELGTGATDLRLQKDADTVVIIDADGDAGGELHAYHVRTDASGEAAEMKLVGIIHWLNLDVVTESYFV